jgi:DNA-cytosine methyltransferase
MNVLSLFDGMSCGQHSLKELGIKVDNYFASEIDKYAIQVNKKNFPNTIQLGDVKEVKAKDLPVIDLILAGSPCQGFSFAGKQLNFDDPRSALFFEFIRILNEVKEFNPNVKFLLKNVKMKKESENVITNILQTYTIFINSKIFVPQSRPRLYWTNINTSKDLIVYNKPNYQLPKSNNMRLKDILENDVDKKYYLSKKMIDGFNAHKEKFGKTGFGWSIKNENNIANCVTTKEGSRPQNTFIKTQKGIRRLTPIECERLQGLSNNYTLGVSDTQRYKMIGNGWTIPVIKFLLKELNEARGK